MDPVGEYPIDDICIFQPSPGGYESVQILRKAGNNQTKMYIIPNAGHHGKVHIPFLRWLMLIICT